MNLVLEGVQFNLSIGPQILGDVDCNGEEVACLVVGLGSLVFSESLEVKGV